MPQPIYSKILVPVDGPGWSERAVPHAARIARTNKATLILLHVHKPPMHDYIDQMALAGVMDVVDQARERAEQYLTGLTNQLKQESVDAHFAIVDGVSPAAAICDYITHEDIDLVVMSTHGRTGLGRFLFGSVARKVMNNVRVPVMLIRPTEPEGKEVIDPA